VKILRYLSPQDLLSLSLVSHAFHQFANWDELWRQLCYDLWEGDFEYKHSWKITTFFPRSNRFNPKLITPTRIDGESPVHHDLQFFVRLLSIECFIPFHLLLF
jgi:hypothetical protein